MGLTDPELDLLREMLADDPGADVFVEVGRELIRRDAHADAMEVLQRGLERRPRELDAWGLLATAATGARRYRKALDALRRVPVDARLDPELARVQVAAMEGYGDTEGAKHAARQFLEVFPEDPAMLTTLSRLRAPPPDPAAHARDPYLTVSRAEQYVLMGRLDRAVRAYRRILLNNAASTGISARLQELMVRPHEPVLDDLSEELTDPGAVAVEPLAMPAPALAEAQRVLGDEEEAGFDEDEVTQVRGMDTPDGEPPAERGTPRPLPGRDAVADALRNDLSGMLDDDEDYEDEPTQVFRAVDPDGEITLLKKDGKRRRSLLRR